jgi:hypothetical protein
LSLDGYNNILIKKSSFVKIDPKAFQPAMKFVALSAFLASAVAQAPPQSQGDIPGGRLAKCFFADTFGTGESLSKTGVATFNVVAGAEVRCFTGCKSGGEFTTAYQLGSTAPVAGSEPGSTEDNEFCESTDKWIADQDYTELRWSISTTEPYSWLSITCFWYALRTQAQASGIMLH